MSEFLRAAREKLRGAIADIDARLAELEAFKAEEAQLREHRASLLALLGEPSSDQQPTSHESRTRPAATPTPVASPPAREAGAPRSAARVQAANRMLAAVTSARDPLRYADLAKAGGLGYNTTKDIVRNLVASGTIRKTGKTSQTRYHLPGSVGAPPADAEGDRGARHARARR